VFVYLFYLFIGQYSVISASAGDVFMFGVYDTNIIVLLLLLLWLMIVITDNISVG